MNTVLLNGAYRRIREYYGELDFRSRLFHSVRLLQPEVVVAEEPKCSSWFFLTKASDLLTYGSD